MKRKAVVLLTVLGTVVVVALGAVAVGFAAGGAMLLGGLRGAWTFLRSEW